MTLAPKKVGVPTLDHRPLKEAIGETIESKVDPNANSVIDTKDARNHRNFVSAIERAVGADYPCSLTSKGFYSTLIKLAARFGIYTEDAEDCVQEYITNQISRGIPGYKPEITEDTDIMQDKKLWPYVLISFCNQCKRFLRKKLRDKSVPMPNLERNNTDDFRGYFAADTPTPDELCIAGEEPTSIALALNRLKPKHQEIIRLAYLSNFSYEQIAVIEGIPVGTVKSRLNTAVSNLAIIYRDMNPNHFC